MLYLTQFCKMLGSTQFGKMLCLTQVSPTFLGNCWYGVDVSKEDISDNMESCVWEPVVVKKNAIIGACEAACLVLSVDETIKNPKASQGGEGMPGRGRGRPM